MRDEDGECWLVLEAMAFIAWTVGKVGWGDRVHRERIRTKIQALGYSKN